MIIFLTIIQQGIYSSEETIQRRKLFKGGNYLKKNKFCYLPLIYNVSHPGIEHQQQA